MHCDYFNRRTDTSFWRNLLRCVYFIFILVKEILQSKLKAVKVTEQAEKAKKTNIETYTEAEIKLLLKKPNIKNAHSLNISAGL